MRLRYSARAYLLAICLLAVLAAVPFVVPEYFMSTFYMIMIYVTLGSAVNLISGYTGYLSLGHAFFFGIGAYAMALVLKWGSWGPAAGVLAAVVLSTFVAYPIGLVTLRLRGPFFVMLTYALAEFGRLVVLLWEPVTDGPNGIMLTYHLASRTHVYYAGLLMAVLAVGTAFLIDQSRLGTFLKAIGEDEDTAEASGINTTKTKVTAFAISAGLAGLAGAYYAVYTSYIDPEIVFSFNFSIAAVVAMMLGGSGMVLGPVIGGAATTILSELLRRYMQAAGAFAYGLLLLLIVYFLPKGITGYFREHVWPAGRPVKAEEAACAKPSV